MTEQEKYMYTAAIKALQEDHDIGESFIANTKFDDNPQCNPDGSITHGLVITIDDNVYDVNDDVSNILDHDHGGALPIVAALPAP